MKKHLFIILSVLSAFIYTLFFGIGSHIFDIIVQTVVWSIIILFIPFVIALIKKEDWVRKFNSYSIPFLGIFLFFVVGSAIWVDNEIRKPYEKISDKINNVKENRERIGISIDKGVNEIKPMLPIDFENGIVWKDAINEYNANRVFIYEVSNEGLDVVEKFISKNQLLQDSKAGDAYKIAKDVGINCIWRYYHNDKLIKEIVIEPQDW